MDQDIWTHLTDRLSSSWLAVCGNVFSIFVELELEFMVHHEVEVPKDERNGLGLCVYGRGWDLNRK